MKTMKKPMLLLAFIIFSFGLFAQDFEVAPVALEFTLEPGESESKAVRVTNYSAKEYNFVLEIFDENYNGEQTERYLPAGSTPNSLAGWLTINPSYITLRPNESKMVDVTLSVPSNASETRWAVIGVRTAQERSIFEADKNLAAGVLVSPRIKVTVTQSPKSNLNFKAKIEKFALAGKTDEGFQTFEVTVKNSGNKTVTANLGLMVANIKSGKEFKEDQGGVVLMPGQAKSFKVQLNQVLPKGEYAIAAVLDYGKNSPLEVMQLMLTE